MQARKDMEKFEIEGREDVTKNMLIKTTAYVVVVSRRSCISKLSSVTKKVDE